MILKPLYHKIKYTFFLKILILNYFLILFFSCQRIPDEVQQTLKLAGNNRFELENVINHYHKPEDSLKLKAAYFLIQNMSNKYSLEGEQLNKLNAIFPAIEKARKKNLITRDFSTDKYLVVDSLWNQISIKNELLQQSELSIKLDINTITSNFLIENIDYAFKVWDLPWSNHLSFNEFCEYILPYRISDEALISWRPLIYKQNSLLLDSLKTLKIKDPVTVCKIINKRLLSKWIYNATIAQYPAAITADNLMKCYMGSCKDQTALAIFTMRSLGVPVVFEQIPHYGNRSLGHDFNAVLAQNSKPIDFEAGDDERFGHILKSQNEQERYIPKIYRETYSLSQKSLINLKPKDEEIPFFFMNLSMIDVTSKYLPVSTIKVKLTEQTPKNCTYAYLCVFDNKKWQPIAWAAIKDDLAIFKNMGRGIIYMPMYYSNGKLIPASSPIILNKTGVVNNTTPSQEKLEMILKRKYKPNKAFQSKMINTSFQASNNIDFKKAITLYRIKDSLELTQHNVLIKLNKKYRYVRCLISANTGADISEISFSDKRNTSLTGKIINSENVSTFILDNNDIVKNSSIKNAFDNDLFSFAVIRGNSIEQWIGLDFGTKKNIAKISFCPRTDKNDVWPDLNYELFYWDKGWKSLGQRKALTNTLKFKSPISNALFLLKCLDEGEEERIFTYEKGNQTWW